VKPIEKFLVAASAALIVGSVIGVSWASQPDQGSFSGTEPPPLFYLVQAAYAFAPWLMLVGLAIIPGLLFLRAHRWDLAERSRLSPPPAPSR
jgi:4-amino-4-deoxy-L-arabinose transferase-like glycosyltransferase